jgi:phage terminase large subunit
VFVAVSADGKAYVYDDVQQSGLVVSEAAKRILEKSEGVEMFIAPSDLWSRQKDSGKSIAELFGENGVYLTKLVSDRVSGWMCLREYLKVETDKDGNKTSRLRIMRNCTNLIRCLPLLLHDKTRSGDASTSPHAITHAPDALRYFAVSRQNVAPLHAGKSKIKLSRKLGVKK